MKSLLVQNGIIKHKDALVSLFGDGPHTIGDFVRQTEKLSEELFKKLMKADMQVDSATDIVNAFKGDIFEIFSEIFFAEFESDPQVGLTDYQPVDRHDDYGVDAIATNPVGNKVAVQAKFRLDPFELIDWDSLAKTYSAGRLRHDLPLDQPDTIFLITTGDGATQPCHDVLGRKLRVINRRIISGKVDENLTFWANAEQRLVSTIQRMSK
jgi:hypothetical protein